MSGSQRRTHRRRTGSTARRYRPSELVPTDNRRHRIGPAELLASGAVATVSILLIVLIWIVANRAIQDQHAETLDKAEQTMKGQAAILAEEVRHELLLVDQSLAILQDAWKRDSEQVDLTQWQKIMPAITSVSDDIFIADENRIIRQDILPAAVGQGVGAAYVTFPHGSLESFDSDGNRNREGRLAVGQTATPIDGREFLMYVVRPLDHPKNWLVGASYRSDELPRLFAESNLGFNGIAALVDAKRGVIQAVIGPSARRPKVDVSKSPMYEAIQRGDSGLWIGPTATDELQRLLAYHRVPDRDIIVVAGTPLAQVMGPADGLAQGYRSVASVASLIVATIGGMMLWGLFTLRANARRHRVFERGQTELASTQTDLVTARARANLTAMQLHSLVEGSGEGIAILDSELCLSSWNPAYVAAARLEPDALCVGLPLDELLRRQAQAGAFGPLEDLEAEVARRVASLRTQRDRAELPQSGPQDEPITLHARGVPDGGLVLILGGATFWQPNPAAKAMTNPEDEEPAPAGSASIEW